MDKPKEGASSATWERDVQIIFCDLCLREIELGNRSTTHFNKEGWMNLIKNFYEKTGRECDKTQLKNKWSQLKKDWKLWKELKQGSTGLGWDPKRKTIDAPDEWWKEKIEVIPNAKKFRYCGIDPELEHKFDLMFMGDVPAGVHAWTLNQGHNHENVRGNSEQVDSTSYSFNDASPNFNDISESKNLKRQLSTTCTTARKKRLGSKFLRTQITRLVDACTNIRSGATSSQSTIKSSLISDAIKILDQTTEVFDDMPLYLFSTKIIENPIKREIFMAMHPERRVHYLRYCYENRNA